MPIPEVTVGDFVALPAPATQLALLLRAGLKPPVPTGAVIAAVGGAGRPGCEVVHLDRRCWTLRREPATSTRPRLARLASVTPLGLGPVYACRCAGSRGLTAWLRAHDRVSTLQAAVEYANWVAGRIPDQGDVLDDEIGVLRMVQFALDRDSSVQPVASENRVGDRLAAELADAVSRFEQVAAACPPPALEYARRTGERLDWFRWVLHPRLVELDRLAPMGYAGSFQSAIGRFSPHGVLGGRVLPDGRRQVIVHAPLWALHGSGGDVVCLGPIAPDAVGVEPASVAFDLFDEAVAVQQTLRHRVDLVGHEALEAAVGIVLPSMGASAC